MGLRVLFVMACALVAGCTQSNSVVCGNLICSEAAVCSPAGDTCVLPTQLDACKGKADDAPCTFPGVTMGACVTGVCTEVVCGNGHTDAITGEVCDDGNRVSGDGCSADCKSKEVCGDGILDIAHGEECDCGMDTPATGCTHPNTNTAGAECRPGCKRSRCGDGTVDPGEQCDDGNVDPGDGCRADCQGRWTQMTTNTFVDLYDVYAVSATEAYAVGASSHFLRWNGTHWVLIPGPTDATNELTDVWAVNASAVYALRSNTYKVYHYNGNIWTSFDPRSNTEAMNWNAISGTGPNDIWVVGAFGSAARFAHFDGNWTSYGSTNLDSPLTSVYAAPGGPVYAVDGNHHVHTLSVNDPYASPPLTIVTTTSVAEFVAGTSAQHVAIAAGSSASTPAASPGTKVFDGTTWTHQFASEEMPFVSDVGAATDGTMNQQISIGGRGNTMVCDASGCVGWTANTSAILTGIGTYGYNRAFIVGTNGTILY